MKKTLKLTCPVCGYEGIPMQKITKIKTSTGEYKTYRYWYIYHGKKSKKQWCYLSKKLLKLQKVKESIKQTTQTTKNVENLNSSSIRQNIHKL